MNLILAAPHLIDDDRIIGGNITTIEEYPYQCQLRRNNGHICGCSILTATRALTAAHCIRANEPPSMYSIKAGSTFRLDQGDPNAQIRVLSRFIRHPNWNINNTLQADIAVVHFTRPLIFGANVRPITLPPPNYRMPYGQLAITTGWGLTATGINGTLSERLRAVAKPIWINADCRRAYHGVVNITRDMVCAGFRRGGASSCAGDSGGPMVVRGVQVGIVSFGRECAAPNQPSVYARVPFFISWIRRNI